MQLLIKQRVFSWSDTFDIYDENKEQKYFVKGKAFSLGHQLHVFDGFEREIGVIKQKIMTFLPTFEVEIGGRIIGNIEKKFSFIHPKYETDYNGWTIEGDFLGWNYNIYDNDTCIIQISKEYFNWGDTYIIDFLDPNDEVMGLMLVLAIDAANCSSGN